MQCPNCGSYQRLGPCDCTWEEKCRAVEIRRKQAAEFRRKIVKPTVVERELEIHRRNELNR